MKYNIGKMELIVIFGWALFDRKRLRRMNLELEMGKTPWAAYESARQENNEAVEHPATKQGVSTVK